MSSSNEEEPLQTENLNSYIYKLSPINTHPLYNDPVYGKQLKTNLKNSVFIGCPRDGNCLYRAIALKILPLLLNEKFIKNFFSFSNKFQKAGIDSSVYDWNVESIEELIESLKNFPKIEEMLSNIREENLLLLIAYLRLLCSSQAQSDEKYRNFVEMDLENYCKRNIEPMNLRAGDFEIAVLAEGMQIKITVFSIFTGQRVSYGEGEEIEILHSPDHFEAIES